MELLGEMGMRRSELTSRRSLGFYDNAFVDRMLTAQDAEHIFDALFLRFATSFPRSTAEMRRQYDILHRAQFIRHGWLVGKHVECRARQSTAAQRGD